MRNIMKKVLIIVPILFTLTGCWDYVGLDEITIVVGCAIDKDSNGYNLTFEVVDLIESTKDEGIKTNTIVSSGKNIFDAVRNAKKKVMNKLYFSNAETFVISKDIAKEDGIDSIINWLIRDAETRDTAVLIISNSETAKDILTKSKIYSAASSFEIKDIVQNDISTTSSTKNIELYTAYNLLKSKTKSLVLPIFSIVENNDKEVPEVTGLALFKKDKYIGSLTSEESKYYLFIDDSINGGIITLKYKSEDIDFDNISLEISKSYTNRSFSFKDNKFEITISINTKVYLAEFEEQNGKVTESEVKEIEKKAEEKIKDEILNLINNIKKEYKHDVFGFGNTVYQQNPKLWKKVKDNWDEYFVESNIIVKPKVRIKNTALLK